MGVSVRRWRHTGAAAVAALEPQEQMALAAVPVVMAQLGPSTALPMRVAAAGHRMKMAVDRLAEVPVVVVLRVQVKPPAPMEIPTRAAVAAVVAARPRSEGMAVMVVPALSLSECLTPTPPRFLLA